MTRSQPTPSQHSEHHQLLQLERKKERRKGRTVVRMTESCSALLQLQRQPMLRKSPWMMQQCPTVPSG
jgi:hypothetical protein